MTLLATTRWGKDGIWAKLLCGQSGGTEEWEGSILLFHGRQEIGYVVEQGIAVFDSNLTETVVFKKGVWNDKATELEELRDNRLRLSLDDLFKLGLIIGSVDEDVLSDIWEKCVEESK